ncbi:hypothetical protein [Streptomyces halobius]|uniref:Uncharacterized protein n=1 Tax=Streptomyces halobius TaxID=2879846 RepID=A0ABY4M4I0_9ACTN|nr:hypothetical protein [Streptomyces halobius]UQA91270.1 hypothetical protein K9S39_04695 [Streptomyces halobius]
MRLPVSLRLGRAAWEPHGGSAWKSASLVARGLGASSCQMYHETWYTPENRV